MANSDSNTGFECCKYNSNIWSHSNDSLKEHSGDHIGVEIWLNHSETFRYEKLLIYINPLKISIAWSYEENSLALNPSFIWLFSFLFITSDVMYIYFSSKDGCSLNIERKIHPTPMNTAVAWYLMLSKCIRVRLHVCLISQMH